MIWEQDYPTSTSRFMIAIKINLGNPDPALFPSATGKSRTVDSDSMRPMCCETLSTKTVRRKSYPRALFAEIA
jgi:hypothetical protein